LTTGKKEKVEDTTKLTPRKRPAETRGTVARVNTGCGSLYITVAYDDKGIFEVFATLGKSGGCASAQLEATCRLITLALRSGIDVASVVKQMKGIRCPSIAWEGKAILSCADAIASVLEKHIGDDSGHGEESSKLDVAIKTGDSGHLVDKVKNLAAALKDNDSGQGEESSKLGVALKRTDSGHGEESSKLDAALKRTESGHSVDAPKNLAGQCPECGNLLVYQEGCYICPSCGYTKC
jgi:ribonucleoside-diphosphate reductase alpha chain